MSDPQRPHGLQPSRLLHPWDFPGKSTGVGCHTFIIFKKVKPHTRCYWYCLWGFKFTHVFTILSLFISSLTVSLPSGIAFFLHAVHPLEFPFEWFLWKQVFLVLGFFNFILILEIYFLWVQNSRLVGFFFFFLSTLKIWFWVSIISSEKLNFLLFFKGNIYFTFW